MKNSLLNELFELRAQKEDLQGELKKIDESKAPIVTTLEAVQLKLEDVQKSILEEMKSEGIKTIQHEDKNVTASVRKTLGIVDESKLMEALNLPEYLKKIKEATGIKVADIKKRAFQVVVNKPAVKEMMEAVLTVDRELLPGTELKETSYLTVK